MKPIDDRGQVEFDFAIGVSILVMTIVVGFTFVPGLFGGVTEGRAQGDQVAADRVGSSLVDDGLGDPSMPGSADSSCVIGFFDGSEDHCGFDGGSVADNVFITDRNVNVSVETEGERVCWDDSSSTFKSGASCGSSDLTLASGTGPSGGSDVAVTSRAIEIDGYQAKLLVRVW